VQQKNCVSILHSRRKKKFAQSVLLMDILSALQSRWIFFTSNLCCREFLVLSNHVSRSSLNLMMPARQHWRIVQLNDKQNVAVTIGLLFMVQITIMVEQGDQRFPMVSMNRQRFRGFSSKPRKHRININIRARKAWNVYCSFSTGPSIFPMYSEKFKLTDMSISPSRGN